MRRIDLVVSSRIILGGRRDVWAHASNRLVVASCHLSQNKVPAHANQGVREGSLRLRVLASLLGPIARKTSTLKNGSLKNLRGVLFENARTNVTRVHTPE